MLPVYTATNQTQHHFHFHFPALSPAVTRGVGVLLVCCSSSAGVRSCRHDMHAHALRHTHAMEGQFLILQTALTGIEAGLDTRTLLAMTNLVKIGLNSYSLILALKPRARSSCSPPSLVLIVQHSHSQFQQWKPALTQLLLAHFLHCPNMKMGQNIIRTCSTSICGDV